MHLTFRRLVGLTLVWTVLTNSNFVLKLWLPPFAEGLCFPQTQGARMPWNLALIASFLMAVFKLVVFFFSGRCIPSFCSLFTKIKFMVSNKTQKEVCDDTGFHPSFSYVWPIACSLAESPRNNKKQKAKSQVNTGVHFCFADWGSRAFLSTCSLALLSRAVWQVELPTPGLKSQRGHRWVWPWVIYRPLSTPAWAKEQMLVSFLFVFLNLHRCFPNTCSEQGPEGHPKLSILTILGEPVVL